MQMDFQNVETKSPTQKMTKAKIHRLGSGEEAFGHYMIHFAVTEKMDQNLTENSKTSFSAYDDPGLIHLADERFVVFVSPIGNSGLFDVENSQFAIVYPIICLDLLEKQFTFISKEEGKLQEVTELSESTWQFKLKILAQDKVISKTVKLEDFNWYAGLDVHLVEAQFIKMYPRTKSFDRTHSKPRPGILGRFLIFLQRLG